MERIPLIILNARKNGTKQKTRFLADEVAGVGFDDQPDEETGREVEGADGAGCDVDLKNCAGFHAEGDHGAASFEGFDRAGKNVASAEEVRRLGGDENVAGADGYADFTAGFGVA